MEIYTLKNEVKTVKKDGLDMILWYEGLWQFNFVFDINCNYIGYVIEDEEEFKAFKELINKNPNFIENIRQNYIEGQWCNLSYVDIDKNNCIYSKFLMWEQGTSIQEIWGWFNKNYKKGIHYLHDYIA
jgi:hypothetical protein